MNDYDTISAASAQRLLNVDNETLWTLIRMGMIRGHVKLGGEQLVSTVDVEYVHRQQLGPDRHTYVRFVGGSRDGQYMAVADSQSTIHTGDGIYFVERSRATATIISMR